MYSLHVQLAYIANWTALWTLVDIPIAGLRNIARKVSWDK